MVTIAAPAPGLELAAAMIRILPKPLGGSAAAANCPPRLHRIDKETSSALIAVVALFFIGLIPTEPVGRAKPNWPLLIPHRRLPAAPPVPLSSMPGQPTQAY